MAEKSREFVFYWVMSATYMGIIYYDSFSGEKLEKVGITLHKAYGGRYKFLTFINLACYFFLYFYSPLEIISYCYYTNYRIFKQSIVVYHS